MDARIAATILAVVTLLWIASCGHAPPKRPANVPVAAIFASGAKVGWWHYCEFDRNDNQAHCTIWNQGGLVLYEGVFLPSDHRPLKADELKIVYNGGSWCQLPILIDCRSLPITWRGSGHRRDFAVPTDVSDNHAKTLVLYRK